MILGKGNSFAFLPKYCERCECLFVWETYRKIEETYKQDKHNVCKECMMEINKISENINKELMKELRKKLGRD